MNRGLKHDNKHHIRVCYCMVGRTRGSFGNRLVWDRGISRSSNTTSEPAVGPMVLRYFYFPQANSQHRRIIIQHDQPTTNNYSITLDRKSTSAYNFHGCQSPSCI